MVTDNPDALALNRAAEADIETAVVRWNDHSGRDTFSEAMADVVEASGAKMVVLAGFMRILSPVFVDRFPNRILNIHPSLLPAFPGAHAVEKAIEHRVKITGVTVHLVDELVDHGPIIAQRSVVVHPEDTTATLRARIQVEEHDLYPRVVRAMIDGDITIEGRQVVLG